MRVRGNVCDGDTGGQLYCNIILSGRKAVFFQIRGGEPLVWFLLFGTRAGIGFIFLTVCAVRSFFCRLAGITGSHYSGKYKLVDTLCWGDQLCIVKLNANRVPRHDIGYIHGKYIGTLLFQK